MEEISRLSRNVCYDVLLNYICNNYDEIEHEHNGDEKKPKRHNRNFCTDYSLELTIDCQRSNLVCTKCGSCDYCPVYVTLYNHTMQPLRRKCVYKRSDNFKVILN